MNNLASLPEGGAGSFYRCRERFTEHCKELQLFFQSAGIKGAFAQ